MSCRLILSLMLGATLLCGSAVRAADGKPIDGDIARWLVQLSDRVPSVREAARNHLRSIDRDDLESLREAVVRNLPAAKAHEELIQDIVEQVFLAGEAYESTHQQGFLGVRFDFDQAPPGEDPPAFPYCGVEIRHLLPGLAGSKYLEIGDVVTSVKVGATILEIGDAPGMIRIIGALHAGQAVTFHLLRRGKILDVDTILSAPPPGAIERLADVVEQFLSDRQLRADDYWDEHFAPIFDGRIAAPAARASVGP